jgi:hypothetical protein
MSRTVATVNPATGESLQTYDAAGIDDVLAILETSTPPSRGGRPCSSSNAPTTCAPLAPSSASSGTSWPR